MNTYKIKLADGLALLLLLVSYLAPFFANQIKVNINVLTMLINCYIIAYLAYNISFADSKKVLLMALPLIIYGTFIIFYTKGFKLTVDKYLLTDIQYLIVNFFDVIFVVFVFFIIELVLSRIFGTNITSVITALGILLYLAMHNTTYIPFDFYYKDLLVYFAFYVLATRINPAKSINKFLYPLAFILFVGEVYLVYTKNFYLGIYFSLFILTYIILKGDSPVGTRSFGKYLTFAYIYPYKLNYILLASIVDASPLIVTVMAILVTFLLGEILFKLKVKFLDYIFLGVH